MFNNQLNWWQRIVKHTVYFLMFFSAIYIGFTTVVSRMGIEKQIITETRYVNDTTKVKDIGELLNGDVVLFNGMTVCVSSFETNNIAKSNIDDEPPVVIFFRKAGDCL